MIVIVGAGPAGRTAAVHLATAGEEVQLVEGEGIGGQCLNYGCMVICALNDLARTLNETRNLQSLGILDSTPSLHFPTMIRQLRGVQETIAKILDEETRNAGVEILYGNEARLEGKHLTIGDEHIDADALVLATGSKPAIPDIPGVTLPEVFNPHTLGRMSELPDRMAVIGGGIMAAEIAYAFQQFGSDVSLIARSQLLKGLDPKLRKLAIKELDNVQIYTNTSVVKINGATQAQSITIEHLNSTKQIDIDAVFVAAGLVPRTENLAGIKKGSLEEVVVDRRMRTNIEGIYAAGDVTGPPYLTPVSRHEGIVAAENILGHPCAMDYRYIPQFMSLKNEFGFFDDGTTDAVAMSVPGPAGPGSFWGVPNGDTGVATIRIDPIDGRICGMSTAAPAGGIIAAYMAFLAHKEMTVYGFEEFMEVHPMADGIYGLIRYASGYLKNKGL
jgi:dihydrolipoamide dehydrogenase